MPGSNCPARLVAGQAKPPVGAGLPLAGRHPPAVAAAFEPDPDARRGAPGRRVENVRGQRHRPSSFVIRRRVIFSSSARTTAPFGILIVPEPGPQPGEHLLAARAAGADQEDVAEALFVGEVSLRQPLPHLVAGRRGPRLLRGRHPAAGGTSPIRGCPFMLSTISSQVKASNAASMAASSAAGSRYGPPGGDRLRERARRAARQDVPLGVLRRGRVEGTEGGGRGRLRAQVRHANIQSGPARQPVAARQLNHR